ncbi:unnamed protein product [Soboliphyme baturini]|uniref:Uncharacterized protein n=1 Tax=Soboliphyme baturini TaxID=241478 RepID=A0A183J8Z2_9BILA|nr:unnamed protein product [Soboliphyme baturini]
MSSDALRFYYLRLMSRKQSEDVHDVKITQPKFVRWSDTSNVPGTLDEDAELEVSTTRFCVCLSAECEAAAHAVVTPLVRSLSTMTSLNNYLASASSFLPLFARAVVQSQTLRHLIVYVRPLPLLPQRVMSPHTSLPLPLSLSPPSSN